MAWDMTLGLLPIALKMLAFIFELQRNWWTWMSALKRSLTCLDTWPVNIFMNLFLLSLNPNSLIWFYHFPSSNPQSPLLFPAINVVVPSERELQTSPAAFSPIRWNEGQTLSREDSKCISCLRETRIGEEKSPKSFFEKGLFLLLLRLESLNRKVLFLFRFFSSISPSSSMSSFPLWERGLLSFCLFLLLWERKCVFPRFSAREATAPRARHCAILLHSGSKKSLSRPFLSSTSFVSASNTPNDTRKRRMKLLWEDKKIPKSESKQSHASTFKHIPELLCSGGPISKDGDVLFTFVLPQPDLIDDGGLRNMPLILAWRIFGDENRKHNWPLGRYDLLPWQDRSNIL